MILDKAANPRRRVLCVDDSVTSRAAIVALLSSLHTTEISVEVGPKEGLLAAFQAAYRKLPFEFLILDVNMEPFDGFELLRRLRAIEAYKSVPAIFISGSKDELLMERARELNAAVLPKGKLRQHRDTLAKMINELRLIPLSPTDTQPTRP